MYMKEPEWLYFTHRSKGYKLTFEKTKKATYFDLPQNDAKTFCFRNTPEN